MAVLHGGASEERPWPDLPVDLLSAIYLRSVSAYGRAAFAAVCSPWRTVAAWHPRLPALPLLLPSTGDGERDQEARAYSPEDGRALRVPLRWFPWGNRLVGTYQGGWIATVSGSAGLLVVNMFSGVRAARLSIEGMVLIRKIVFSKDPSSGGCAMALLSSGYIGVRRVGCPDRLRTPWCGYRDLLDIAFCNGKLYGVNPRRLILFDMGANNDEDAPVAICQVLPIDVRMNSFYTMELSSTVKYIFELHDKLAIAVEVEYRCEEGMNNFFRVFELAENDDKTKSHKYAWAEVTSLGDHALFLGPANCKAEHISKAGQRAGVEANHIYYSRQHANFQLNNIECLHIGTCTVHCSKSESKHHLERIVSRGYHYRNRNDSNGCNACVWLWPPGF